MAGASWWPGWSRASSSAVGGDDIGFVVDVGRQALWLSLLVSAPMLLAGLVVGVSISLLQAVTQIHEMTLTFIPKILAVTGVLLLLLPWMLEQMVAFQSYILETMPTAFRG